MFISKFRTNYFMNSILYPMNISLIQLTILFLNEHHAILTFFRPVFSFIFKKNNSLIDVQRFLKYISLFMYL